MNQSDILQIALEQSARDYSCAPEDFLQTDPKAVLSRQNEGARVYLPLPLACSLVSYGNNVVAQTSEDLREPVLAFLRRFPPEHCFETPNLYVLNDLLHGGIFPAETRTSAASPLPLSHPDARPVRFRGPLSAAMEQRAV